MKVCALVLVAVVCALLPSDGDAICCRKHKFTFLSPEGRTHRQSVCGDCSWGTPYCSYQGCNMFGCNCDGGCRKGRCDGDGSNTRILLINLASEDANDVIRAADQNGDGMMTIQEAHDHVIREALPANQMKRSLRVFSHGKKEALPANQVKRSLTGNASYNHLKRSLEAMDIDKDNFLSAKEIDSNTE